MPQLLDQVGPQVDLAQMMKVPPTPGLGVGILQKEILIWAGFGTQTFGLLGSRTPHISRGRRGICQHGAFSGIAVIVASFVPTEWPKGGVCGLYLERP